MFTIQLRKASLVVLATLASLGANTLLFAEQPQSIVRTFAVEMEGPDALPDFLSTDSLGVVVGAPSSDAATLTFSDHSNSDVSFDSTVWAYRPALHVTTDGADTPGVFWWLLTDETPAVPPSGSVTFTGPDSPQILNQEIHYIKACDSANCLGEPTGRYRISDSSSYSGVIVVVTAVFSR
jgi:hypothetical protein